VTEAKAHRPDDDRRDRSPLTAEERAAYLPPPRLTPEEQDRWVLAIEEIHRLNAEMRAGGRVRPFSRPAWRLINDARDERTRQLG